MEWYGSVQNRIDEGKQKLGKSISTEELRAIIGGASVADVGAPVWQG